MKLFVLSISIFILTITQASCSDKQYLYNLATDMIMETDVVFKKGIRTTVSIEDYYQTEDKSNYQIAEIRSNKPRFSWMIYSNNKNTLQKKYKILVSSSKELIDKNEGDLWNSGYVESDNSVAIKYNGKKLNPSTLYYWKVKIVDNNGKKYDFSEPKAFVTANDLDDYTSILPLEVTIQQPTSIKTVGKSIIADFSTDAFSQVNLRLNSFTGKNENITIHLGEDSRDGLVNQDPPGTVRYKKVNLTLNKGYSNYTIEFKPDSRNTDPNMNGGLVPVLMPNYIGEVFPFRYLQIDNYNGPILYSNIKRRNVNYPFHEDFSYFECSDTVINKVWELCKYTMKATSFTGFFVDGDRERTAYEADAYINQLSHYVVDYQYSISRNTLERLIYHATWPIEWNLQTVLIAYNDYLYTGDISFLEKYYEKLRFHTLTELKDDDDLLLHTNSGIYDQHTLKNLNCSSQRPIQDIVDWPIGERDGYKMDNCNSATNAFYYKALETFSKIAKLLENNHDFKHYEKFTNKVLTSFNDAFKDSTGLYFDNDCKKYNYEGSDTLIHKSLHANMFPLALGIINETDIDTVVKFVESRGMACSPYGAQFLLDAIFDYGNPETAINLLSDTSMRSWYGMIKQGSTITMEAWNEKAKPNLDWNHAWGAAAGNIICRKLMGIEPIEPGFRRVKISPKLGNLQYATIKTPTPRGTIELKFNKKDTGEIDCTINIPANMVADVSLPWSNKQITIGSGKWNYNYKVKN